MDSARSRAEYRINSPCRDDKRTLPTPRYPMEDRVGVKLLSAPILGRPCTIEWSFRGNLSRLEWIRVKRFGKFAIVPERGSLFFLNRNVPKARSSGLLPLFESVQNEWKLFNDGIARGLYNGFFLPGANFCRDENDEDATVFNFVYHDVVYQ